jgi:membrane protein DedA with SNARE-associated domain
LWERWGGILTMLVTFGLAVLLALNWRSVDQIAGYGYFGGFAVSALGGGTVFVPIPMALVQATLGGLMAPLFGPPFLAPLFVGLISSFGETIGAMSIYMAGLSGATPLSKPKAGQPPGRVQKLYAKLSGLMKRRGALVMFAVSAVMNPFFFPAALACGATRLGAKKYFAVVFAGKFIKVTAIAYAGYFGMSILFNWLGVHV